MYKAAVQHVIDNGFKDVNISHVDLRNHCNNKLIEWWDKFENYFQWPLEVTVRIGENSEKLIMMKAEDYKKFLASDDSKDAWCDSEVELCVLSYILETTICALSFNLPFGTGTGGSRFNWSFFPGQGIVNERSRFSCKPEPLYLLNEHLQHWSRVIPDQTALFDDQMGRVSAAISVKEKANTKTKSSQDGGEKGQNGGEKGKEGGQKKQNAGKKNYYHQSGSLNIQGGEDQLQGVADKSLIGEEKDPTGGEKHQVGGEKHHAGGEKLLAGGEKHLAGGEKPVGDIERPPASGKKPLVGRKKPLVCGRKPRVGGRKLLEGVKKTPLGGEKILDTAEKSPRPRVKEMCDTVKHISAGGKLQVGVGNEQARGETQQARGENQQPRGEHQQPHGEKQQGRGEKQQGRGEKHQNGGGNQQACVGNQQACGEIQQAHGENQQAPGENQQASGENQQARGEKRQANVRMKNSLKRTREKKQKSPNVNNHKHRRKERVDEVSNNLEQLCAEAFVVKEHITDIYEKDIAKKSDVYHTFQVKKNSLDLILKHPTEKEVADQTKYDKLIIQITKEREAFEEEMERVEKNINCEKTRQSLKMIRFRENASRRDQIESLTKDKIQELFLSNRAYFERIHNGEEFSSRFDAFKKGGKNREALKYMMITDPYTE